MTIVTSTVLQLRQRCRFLETVIDQLLQNPLWMAVFVVLAVFVVFSLVKKLIKLAIGAVVVIVLCVGYMAFTGQDIPKNANDLRSGVRTTLKKGAKKGAAGAKKLGNELKKVAKDEIKKEIKKAVD